MGYIAKDFALPDFGDNFKAPELYGKLSHVEIDIPTKYCRLDLHWYADKESSKENKKVFSTWSFVFPPDQMEAFLKQASNQSALAVAYATIREMDPRFESIRDDI